MCIEHVSVNTVTKEAQKKGSRGSEAERIQSSTTTCITQTRTAQSLTVDYLRKMDIGVALQKYSQAWDLGKSTPVCPALGQAEQQMCHAHH